LKYKIIEDLLYVNADKPWSKVKSGEIVESISYGLLGDVDKRYFNSIQKTERKKDFNARVFAFNYEGMTRIAVIGAQGIPREKNK